MLRLVFRAFAAASLFILALPQPALAAAYYLSEFGSKSLARGGANVVNPGDPTAAWLNPAALTLSSGLQLNVDVNVVFMQSSFVRDCGGATNGCAPQEAIDRRYGDHRYQVGGTRAAYDPDGGSSQQFPADKNSLGAFQTPSRFDGKTAYNNQAGPQPIPRAYLSFNTDVLGLDGFAGALYVTAPNAGDYSFGSDTPTRYSLIDRDLYEVYYGLALAYRFSNWIAVGGSLQGVSVALRQDVALTGDQYGNEDPGYDITTEIQAAQHFIPSGNFGIWSNPLKPLGIGDLELGASVQLPRFVKATGPVEIKKFGQRLKDEYLNPRDGDPLVAVDVADDASAVVEFVLPPIYRIGLKYGMDDVLGDGLVGFNVEAALVYEQWSMHDHIYLKTTGVKQDILIDDQKAANLPAVVQPKDWLDTYSVRLGGTGQFFDKMLSVHAGGFYESNAIPNSTYDVQLVCGDKLGLGTGLGGRLWGVDVTLAYMHVFVADRTVGKESIVFSGNSGKSAFVGDNETRTRVAMGKYSASYDMVSLGINVAFDEMLNFGAKAKKATPAPAETSQAPQADATQPHILPVNPEAAQAVGGEQPIDAPAPTPVTP